MSDIWLVAPSYFDVPSFRRLRGEIISAFADDPRSLHFVLIDDAAGADPAVASLPDEETEVIGLPFNVGHQRAITYGLRQLRPRLAADDIVVTLDADGEDRAQDVPALVAAVEGPLRVVLARRTRRQERLSFRIGYAAFRVLFRVLTGRSMRTGNFAAMSGETLRRLLGQPQFDLSYSSSLTVSGGDIEYVDCPRGTRYEGQPKMNRQRLVSHGLRSLMPLQEQIAIRALFASGLVAVLGFVALTVIAVVRLVFDRGVPGWATYSSLLIVAIAAIALSNFVVLFAIFSQSRSVALSNLELDVD